MCYGTSAQSLVQELAAAETLSDAGEIVTGFPRDEQTLQPDQQRALKQRDVDLTTNEELITAYRIAALTLESKPAIATSLIEERGLESSSSAISTSAVATKRLHFIRK